ncbi:MAG: diguanylate cyclase [Bryobacteraceae bacterium]
MVRPLESDAGISSAVLESYLAVIAEIAWSIGVTCPDVASPHQEHLLRMRSRLAFASDEQTLAETREAIENELRTYAERARALLERRADDLRRILKAFSQVTEVLAERNEAGSRQFAEFSARVQGIADVVPWLDVRDALREIVSDAGSQADVLRLDSQLAQAHVEEQIRVFGSRLAARNPQHLDLLTGLGNRQAVEEQITRRMEAGKPFTLLLFETEGLADVVASVGAAAADQVLVQAASRLEGQVRAHDYVGRWDASEFAIVMECPIENAEPRSQQIARWLSGTYVLRGSATETLVEVTFTVRVVDPAQVAASSDEEPATSPLPA